MDKDPQPDEKLRVLKGNFKTSEFQKSERDFAFVIDKDYQSWNIKKRYYRN